MLDHKILYNSDKISANYAERDYLEEAEEAILEELEADLKNMDMLDMGVGGGRTTRYFAPLAGSYIGADYARAMIKICNDKYKGKHLFLESDARSMDELSDNSFDFVLFSFNGIDSFTHEDRIIALKEIRRVLKNNGYFCFSSHNLNWENLSDIFRFKSSKIKLSKNAGLKGCIELPKERIKFSHRTIRLSYLNRSFIMKNFIEEFKENGRGSLYDNSLHGKASIYYITRAEQIRQLESSGFINIQTYSREGIKTDIRGQLNKGGWIYYFCQVKKD